MSVKVKVTNKGAGGRVPAHAIRGRAGVGVRVVRNGGCRAYLTGLAVEIPVGPGVSKVSIEPKSLSAAQKRAKRRMLRPNEVLQVEEALHVEFRG